MQKLYETYNNCEGKIGYSNNEKERPLLPICHTTAQAHIEIVIDEDGDFQEAHLVTNKDDMTTIIPCTEDSASKSGSAPSSHPLCERLQYVAGDFRDFGGKVTSGFAKKADEPYRSFVNLLSEWCLSEFAHPKAEAVLKYVKKRSVVKDLVEYQILLTGADGKFLQKKDVKRDKNAKDIFSVLTSNSEQQDAFIRWIVDDDELETKVWRDQSLWESWSNYYLSKREEEPFCFVTGKPGVLMTKHPRYIRREGDSAKLISSNDASGFTFRGRFTDKNGWQACNVSLDVSQKAHYALSWLISRQGYQNGDQAIVAWATSGDEIPLPYGDAIDVVDTQQDLAISLRKKIAGYNQKIDPNTDVVVMALDSATTGRMAITYYRELKSSEFLKRLDHWHESCAWLHTYRFVDKVRAPFIGAPAPKDIALAAYGVNRKKEGKAGEFKVDDNLAKSTANRILPCIVDGLLIPRDIVESVVRNASNRVALEDWQWKKTLSIACALYKKHKEGKENYDMALDETRTTRDYLLGRLLAIADRLEEVALYDPNDPQKKRATNATRYMQQFSLHPYRTWGQIHSALIPYMVRLDGAFFYKNMIAEVKNLFASPEDFANDKPLSGEYLLGYYSQRQKLLPQKKQKDSNKKTEE
jgi:CRISPR-associated protein Csd1